MTEMDRAQSSLKMDRLRAMSKSTLLSFHNPVASRNRLNAARQAQTELDFDRFPEIEPSHLLEENPESAESSEK